MALLSMLIDSVIEYLNMCNVLSAFLSQTSLLVQLAIMQKSGEFDNEWLAYLCTYFSWVITV